MKIYAMISSISYFFSFSITILSYINFTRIAASNTATDDATHKSGHTEYLVQTYNIVVLILYSKLLKIYLHYRFLIRRNDDS